jgi:hypothetical protein
MTFTFVSKIFSYWFFTSMFNQHCGKMLELSGEVQHGYKIWTKSTQKSMFFKNLVLDHGSFDRFGLHFSEIPRMLSMQRCSPDAWLHSCPKKIEKRSRELGDLKLLSFYSIQIFDP